MLNVSFNAVLVEPPWPTPYLLVPLNSTVLITCIIMSDSPYWAIDLGTSLPIAFAQRKDVLNNNGFFEVETAGVPVTELQLLVNETESNNQTLIICVGDGREKKHQTRMFLYSKYLSSEV